MSIPDSFYLSRPTGGTRSRSAEDAVLCRGSGCPRPLFFAAAGRTRERQKYLLVRKFKMEVFDAPSHYYPSDAMSLDELSYWITFRRVSGIGPVSFNSLLEYFDNDLEAAWRANTKELAQAGLTRNTIENVITL